MLDLRVEMLQQQNCLLDSRTKPVMVISLKYYYHCHHLPSLSTNHKRRSAVKSTSSIPNHVKIDHDGHVANELYTIEQSMNSRW